MRPILLTFQAFGPYHGVQTLDFRQLDGRSLFLIHGPTGAGKTTILDAICYALYGETSGGERDGKQMRSDHADPQVPTEVTFDFALADERYRVSRRPEQERLKLRGAGMVTDSAQATLWRRTQCVDDADEGTVIVSQANKVTAAIIDMLGFQVSQFRQVVMLPQGRFRELLLASSQDRERILQSLFQTQMYQRIEDGLKRKAKSLYDELKTFTLQRDVLFGQAGVASIAELTEKRASVLQERNAIHEQITVLRNNEATVTGALNIGKMQLAILREVTLAEGALVALRTQEDGMTAHRIRLDQARRAAPLVNAEAMLNRRSQEAENAARQVTNAQGGLTVAHEATAKAEAALSHEKARDAERERLHAQLLQLQGLSEKVQELADARNILAQAEQQVSHCTANYTALTHDAEAITQKKSALEQKIVELRALAMRYDARHLSIQNLERVVALADELLKTRNAQRRAEEKHVSLQGKLAQHDARLAQLRSNYAVLQEAWENGQAAILALSLQPGSPCPVCGATHHPAPTQAAGDLPAEDAVKDARSTVEQAETERISLADEVAAQAQIVSSLQAKHETLTANLGERETIDSDDLRQQLQSARNELTELDAARSNVEILESELTLQSARGEEALQLCRTAEEALREGQRKLEQARAVVHEREHSIPMAMRDIQALNRTITETRETLEEMRQDYDTAVAEEQRTRQAFVAWEERLQAATKMADTARQLLESQQGEFLASLYANGFSDMQVYAIARHDIDQIAALDATVRRYENDLHAAEDRLTRAQAAATGIESPDIARLQTAVDDAKDAVESAVREETHLQEQLMQMDGWLDDLQRWAKQSADTEAQYAVIGRISEVANGKNPHGITFQRFVLGALLDGVLYRASQRLQLMSKGRFTLHRATTRTDMRSSGGLDLEVLDSYTDKLRPVATLSGGESFLASLSLALGLADVVQAYAGGIHLDTVFVDEGFGSLDPESLDLAFRALIDLQTGGRLVGIISHVPELKERIDVRLEVAAGQQGSAARFCITA